MAGWKDGLTLHRTFHRILPVTARGGGVGGGGMVNRYNCSRVAFKRQRYKVQLKLLHHSRHAKTSSIHKLILKIQHILGSHELNDHAHFWPHSCKNHWNNFQFSPISTSMKKIILFHLFILEIQSILESRDQTGCIHFWPYHPKHFWSTFNLCKFVSTCKKLGYFIDLLWR